MSDYFVYSNLTANAVARASDVNSRFAALETGLGYLPTRAQFGLSIKPTVVATGTANAIVVTNDVPLTAYALGQRISFKAAATNTGATTVNVDGVGAVALRRTDGTALVAGDVASGSVYDAIFEGTNFVLTKVTAVDLASYVSSASAQATLAATSASNASSSASSAATSASNSSGSATAAASSASAAATSATNSANSASAASTSASAASTSASAASTSATNAANSATTAGTNASNAATSATNAATNATNSANSATTAAGHVTTASGHASAAATSAGNASSSATAAATSASLSESWATSLAIVSGGLYGSRKYAQDAATSAAAAASSAGSLDTSTYLTKADNLGSLTDFDIARTNLALVPGTDVQAYSEPLETLSGTAPTLIGLTLLQSTDAADARSDLGLGTMATQAANNVAITGGSVDVATLLVNGAPVSGGASASLPASEALAANDLVNVWNDAGVARVRKANATSSGKEAHGFVEAAVTSGATATVKMSGIATNSGLTAGTRYFLSTTGGLVTATAPSTAGNIAQPVGIAISATQLLLDCEPGVLIA